MYDIIFIGDECDQWKKLKSRFPLAKRATTFEEANRKTFTKMFWAVWHDLVVLDNFYFDYIVNPWDENYVHVFKNNEYYDGICLFPKNKNIAQRELEYRFFIDKKEVDIIASVPVLYDKFYISTYEEYLTAIETSTTDMFWVVWKDVTLLDNFEFDYYVPVYDAFHRNITHVFRNGEYYDGICLFPKNKNIARREFDYRFFIDKKEIDVLASTPKLFDKFYISTYEEYLTAIETSTTDMFWVVWDNVILLDNFEFDYYVPVYDAFHRNITHVFRNGEYYDGICLFSTRKKISQREFDYRFFTEKKEVDVQASVPKPFDIVFISYNEPSADDNYKKLLLKAPAAKRIHGVKGIHQAHIEAARVATSDLFWVVDGDAEIVDDFNFNFPQVIHFDSYTKTIVHVWRSRNPVNGLEYGYGGVKLLPRTLTLNMDVTSTDMTMSISSAFKSMDTVSNITAFNTDKFSTWRSAFRECVKLTTMDTVEARERLSVWCTVATGTYSAEALRGAVEGKMFAEQYPTELHKINNFEWLYEQFSKNSI